MYRRAGYAAPSVKVILHPGLQAPQVGGAVLDLAGALVGLYLARAPPALHIGAAKLTEGLALAYELGARFHALGHTVGQVVYEGVVGHCPVGKLHYHGSGVFGDVIGMGFVLSGHGAPSHRDACVEGTPQQGQHKEPCRNGTCHSRRGGHHKFHCQRQPVVDSSHDLRGISD